MTTTKKNPKRKSPYAGKFVRDDIILAYHMFRVDWQCDPSCRRKAPAKDRHGRREDTLQEIAGQLHRMGCGMEYKVGDARLMDYTGVTDNAAKFYDQLCVRFGYNPPKHAQFAGE